MTAAAIIILLTITGYAFAVRVAWRDLKDSTTKPVTTWRTPTNAGVSTAGSRGQELRSQR